MTTPLSAKAAILLALRTPAYGLQIIARVRRRTRGRVRLRPGSVYPALRQLERQGLVRSWKVQGARGGRPRRYYELTLRGIAAAAAQREAFAGLLGARAPVPSTDEVGRMRDRLRGCAGVSAFVLDLRRRMLETARARS